MNHQLSSEIISITSGAMQLPGWCTPEKALHIAETVIAEKPRLVVEVGVFGGRSFLPMVLALEHIGGQGFAVGLDAWSNAAATEGMDLHDADDKKHVEYWGKMDLASIMAKVGGYIEQRRLWHRCALIQGRSNEVFRIFQPFAIDLLHIDGNHTELASCRDVRTWLPLVRPGGAVFFDDTNWPSTQAALRLLEMDCKLEATRSPTPGTEYRLYRKNA